MITLNTYTNMRIVKYRDERYLSILNNNPHFVPPMVSCPFIFRSSMQMPTHKRFKYNYAIRYTLHHAPKHTTTMLLKPGGVRLNRVEKKRRTCEWLCRLPRVHVLEQNSCFGIQHLTGEPEPRSFQSTEAFAGRNAPASVTSGEVL